jgi:hypothetical protein
MNKLPWLVLAAPLLLACRQEVGEELPPDWGRRECPKEWVWDSLRFEGESLGVQIVRPDGLLSGPGPIQNVPEFHDCQKFMVRDAGGSLGYSDYFAIFAVYDSSFLSRRPERDTLSRTAVLALLDTLPEDSEQTPQLEDSYGFRRGDAIPAAEIVAWANYDPLGIKAGFNCLYLARDGGAWQAEMVPSFEEEQDCSEPNPSPGSGKRLGVQSTGVGFRDADYPPVARWDWEETDSLHYIGIKCGAEWCEVHATDIVFDPSLTLERRAKIPHPTAPVKERRTTMVKGWYDEQFLALQSVAANEAVPSGIRGVVVPHPELGDRNSTDAYDDKWLLAAQVALWVPEGANNPYRDKFYFSDTPNPRESMNEIHLCSIGSGNSCAGAEGLQNCSDEWRAKIIRADDGAEMFKCAKRCDMDAAEYLIPGTARWRWKVDDEGVWMRCRNGCCEVT